MAGNTFFSSGIQFECIDCGNCCTGAPGLVRLSEEEADALADYLKRGRAELAQRYLLPHAHGWQMREQKNGDCIFFNGRCSIHPVKPAQCRTYPFWIKNMRSIDRWEQTCRACPGIGQGRTYSEAEILDRLERSEL
jgi:Fe-S-cluster containining protein